MHSYFYFIFIFVFFQASTSFSLPVKKQQGVERTQEALKKQNEVDFRKAEALLYAKKTNQALPRLELLCDEKEYLRACSLLGFAYTSGRYGVPTNFDKGINWYKKCASQEKNFFCQNELGHIFFRQGSFETSFTYYEKGAKAGNATAQYRLGRLYLENKGVPLNSQKALTWLRRASHNKKPNKSAQCLLVDMSYFGIGMRPSMKDTAYWLSRCDLPFIRGLQAFYGHGVPRNKELAKQIFTNASLNEALNDWNDFNLNPRPSVGIKTVRDQAIPEECYPKEMVFGAGRKNPKIQTYGIKIFHKDYYRTFDVHDGFSEKTKSFDQTFEACGRTFYTTLDNKRLFEKSLESRAVIKIGVYKNACLGAEMRGVCDLNLPYQERKKEDF